jgi:hypothetical protein
VDSDADASDGATFGATPLPALPNDEADVGLATHTFQIMEDELGEQQEVIVGGTAPDSDIAGRDLRAIVDTLITESISDPFMEGAAATVTVECDGGEGSAVQSVKVCPHVLVPQRGLVSIQQLVSELNHVRPGAKLSKDRLTRVTQRSGAPDQRTTYQVISTCADACIVISNCLAAASSSSILSAFWFALSQCVQRSIARIF